MKKYISLPLIMAITLLFVGCKKDDGFITKDYLDLLEPVPPISTAVDPTGSQAINMLALASFQGKFTVALYFDDKPAPTKVDIVVRKNGSAANVKVFKANVTTFPSTYTITAAELATLFGTPVVLGDNYDFSADVYVGDKKYEAFPATGVGNSAGPINMLGYSEFARFGAICAYDPAIYEGNFVVVSDGFGDFTPGEVVVFTRVSANSFRFTNPYATNPIPVLVSINTGNNNVTIVKQKIGDKFVWNATYTNPNMAASGPGNFVSPCDKTINMNVTYTVDQGSFGSYPIMFRKQ